MELSTRLQFDTRCLSAQRDCKHQTTNKTRRQKNERVVFGWGLTCQRERLAGRACHEGQGRGTVVFLSEGGRKIKNHVHTDITPF